MFNSKKIKELEERVEYLNVELRSNYYTLVGEIAELREFLGVRYNYRSPRFLEKRQE